MKYNSMEQSSVHFVDQPHFKVKMILEVAELKRSKMALRKGDR